MKFLYCNYFKEGIIWIFLCSLQDLSWDRVSERKFRKWLVFNHKYAGIAKTWEIV